MKFQKMLFAAVAMFAVVGCNSSNNPEDEPAPEGAVYTITIDKDVIEADGNDCVTFTVTDAEGNDLTADASSLNKVYFVNEGDDSRLKRGTRTFSAYRNGTYTFHATYKGKRTQNSVTVTAQNRAKYEKFFHKLCIFQLTGVMCGYCPLLTEGLSDVRVGEYKDQVIILATHGNIPSADPYTLSLGDINDPANYVSDLGYAICAKFGGGGFPYAVIDYVTGTMSRTESAINDVLEGIMLERPATCGIKISKAQIDAEGNAVIEASITAQKAGTYDLAWAVLADNQPPQGGVEPIYHDVVQAVSDNFIAMSDQTKMTLQADEEVTKTFQFKVEPFANVPFDPANCKVVVFAHSNGVIDNANTCAVGATANYQYNE